MSAGNKLPVFETVGEAFSFGGRKIIPIIFLNLITIVLLLVPVAGLAIAFNAEFFSTLEGKVEELTDAQQIQLFIRLFPIFTLLIAAAVLSSPIVNTVIIRKVTHGNSLWLPKLNANTLRYFFTSGIISISSMAIIALGMSLGAIAYVAVSHSPVYQTEAGYLSGFIVALVTLYFLVRLSLVPSEVVAQSKLGVTNGFRITKGNFLRLLSAYIVTIILVIIIALSLAVLGTALGVGPETTVSTTEAGEVPGVNLEYQVTLPDGDPLALIYNIVSFVVQIYLAAVFVALPALAYTKLRDTN